MDSTHPGHGRYGQDLFDAGHPGEAERIDDAALVYDPVTTHRLRALGAGPGLRCLEVGAGTGTVARWLLREADVAEVVAVDRDTGALAAEPRLRVVTANLTDDTLDLGTFDLIHARFVLMHLRERRHLVSRLVSLLNPGGRILLGDAAELPDAHDTSSSSAYRRTMDAMWEALRTTIGTDITGVPAYPHFLREEGLTDVAAELYCPPLLPGGPLARFWSQTWQRMRPELTATGRVDAATVDEALDYLSSPHLAELGPGLLMAWGRRR
ncbi:methyltransferase [Streptomyces davaonensis JCM 4913]|uniref:Methyltransferase n=1 Tax=Streptomyces davaonensis (strain DSM 101723 / JCM 4913 / KCC S-0913 / 768) TaxID=1214101 RepID=K4REV4_STRDJ|nr:class I SAM-dependent methyltransferase [Streptomyces davaonensis]CCK32308.1 methyltransferase [Streptomyces davaonensis JCM 4913]